MSQRENQRENQREDQSELDHMLMRSFGPAQDLQPSSGFVASVMERVHQDSAPAPIAFPWRRALPMVCLALLAAAACAALLGNYFYRAASAVKGMPPAPAAHNAALLAHGLGQRAMQLPLGWLLLALLLALLPSAIMRMLGAATLRS